MRLFVDDYLQVRYVNLYSKKVLDDLKFLVIGDVHISDKVSFKKIDLLKKRISLEKADYIFFVGDLIDNVEEIDDRLFLKINDLLKCASSFSKTFIILGNHDYINKKNNTCHLDLIKNIFKSIDGITLLDNDVYFDDKVWVMGYTEKQKYYGKREYNFKAFYDDFVKYDLLYKNVNTKLPTIALTHSPEFSYDLNNVSLFKDYDLIICGHTHDGCIPFGLGNFNRGLISPKKSFFPKNVRGIRKLGDGYILCTGGIVKIQKCAPKLLHPFNHLCPMQIDVVTFSNKENSLNKKWY